MILANDFTLFNDFNVPKLHFSMNLVPGKLHFSMALVPQKLHFSINSVIKEGVSGVK